MHRDKAGGPIRIGPPAAPTMPPATSPTALGLPGKSGVGGGILAVLPGRGTLCVWSPALDAHGNSVAGVEALDRFTTRTGWSVF